MITDNLSTRGHKRLCVVDDAHLNDIDTVPLSYCTVPIKYEDMRQSMSTTAQCKAWVCGRSLAGIAVSNLVGGMDICLL